MEKFNLRYLKSSAIIYVIGFLVIALYWASNYIDNRWDISISVFAIVLGLLAFINKWLWNKKPFCWLYCVPDFSGRYQGTIFCEFRNEKNENISTNLEHIKIINQNGSDVIINSWTRQKDGPISSKSTSIEASIIKEKDGTYSLIYNYLNEGNCESGFNPHYGTEVLKLIENESEKKLIGRYYTERLPFQTRGKIDMNYINKNLTHLN
jgi:hypothetical protein